MKVFPEIDERMAAWIGAQKMFFVATAPLSGDGMVNLSPKGLDTFQILDPLTVAYVDFVGSGVETSVIDLYDAVAAATGFPDRPQFEAEKPGDVKRSVIDASKAKNGLGWEAWTSLEDGLRRTVDWYRTVC